MGNCSSSNGFFKVRKKSQLLLGGPPVVEPKPATEAADSVKFFVHLSNFKARGLSSESSARFDPYCVIIWDNGNQKFQTNVLKKDSNPKWGFETTFEYTVPAHDLASRKVTVAVVDSSKFTKDDVVGTAEVDLLSVATGPVHHNLPLKNSANKDVGRVAFSIRMVQICRLRIPLKQIKVRFDQPEHEWQYFLVIKPTGVFAEKTFKSTLTEKCKDPEWDVTKPRHAVEHDRHSTGETGARENGEKPAAESRMLRSASLNALNSLKDVHTSALSSLPPSIQMTPASSTDSELTTLKLARLTSDPSEKEKRSSKAPEELDRERKSAAVMWEEEAGPVLPTIEVDMTVETLRSESLRISLYSREDGTNGKVHELHCQCWLPFDKVYKYNSVTEGLPAFDTTFDEKLWLKGRCVGSMSGVVGFENNPSFFQLVAGVHTENGTERISPAIIGREDKKIKFGFNKVNTPQEVKRLAALHNQLLECVFHRPGKSRTADATPVLQELLQLLKKSHKESMRSFVYVDQRSLLTGQRVLLNLGVHLLDYVDHVAFEYRSLYYDCLDAVFRRGELDIGLVALTDTEVHEIQSIVSNLQKAMAGKDSSSLTVGAVPSSTSSLSIPNMKSSTASVGKITFSRSISLSSITVNANMAAATGGTKLSSTQPRFNSGNSFGAPSSALNQSVSRSDSSSGPSLRPLPPRAIGGATPSKGKQSVAYLGASEGAQRALSMKRLEFAQEYRLLSLNTLSYVLDKLGKKGSYDSQRTFIGKFLAVSYFRIPPFRDVFLDLILSEEERETMKIDEWRGTDFDIDEEAKKPTNAIKENHLAQVLDWRHLWDDLQMLDPDDSANVTETLDKLLADNSWKERLGKRTYVYFSLVENWVGYVINTVVLKESVVWKDLPGYVRILKSFLVCMKTKPLKTWTDSMVNASGALLANEKLISVFTKIAFSSTSVYDQQSLLLMFDFLDFWFTILQVHNKRPPPTFDWLFFFEGLTIVLNSDIALHMMKALWFIYKHLQMFKGEPRRILILDILLDQYFYTLFLHWSHRVRGYFHYILLFRIFHEHEPHPVTLTHTASYSNLNQHLSKLGKNLTDMMRKSRQLRDTTGELNSAVFQRYCQFEEYLLGALAKQVPHDQHHSYKIPDPLPLQQHPPTSLEGGRIHDIPEHQQTYLFCAMKEFADLKKEYAAWKKLVEEDVRLNPDPAQRKIQLPDIPVRPITLDENVDSNPPKEEW